MKTFFQWIAGFFQDKDKQASRKAAGLYIGLWFFYLQVKASVDGTLKSDQINQYVFWGTLIFLLFCVGAITAEVVAKVFDTKFNNKPNDTTT